MIRIIFGNEPYLISQIKKESFSMVSDKDFNLSMYESFDEKVLELCATYPVLEDRRVVYIDLDRLSLLNNEFFNAYRKAPAEFTVLLILCRDVDKNTKFAKELKKEGLLYEINKLTEADELKNTIHKFIREKGGSIEPSALKELIARENYFENDAVNLISISHDIDCLLSVSKNISLDMVREYVKDMAVEHIFSLAKLIEKGDALALKKEISLISHDRAIPMLSLLLREYRISYKLTFSAHQDIGIKYHTFRNLSKKQAVQGMRTCTSIIEDIKTGRIDEKIALQLAVGQLLQQRKENA